MSSPAWIIVEGSHGAMKVDPATGLVCGYEWRDDGGGYDDIYRIDLTEFVLHYGRSLLPEEGLDILDVAYWTPELYEPACLDWRTGQNHFGDDDTDRDGVSADTLIFYAQPH